MSDQYVNIISPEEKLVSLPANSVQAALNMGYRMPDQSDINQEKYGSFGQQLITGAEGALNAGTLGLGRLAETKIFGVSPEDIKGREETNPMSSLAGNLAGGAALLVGTGGLAAPIEEAVGAKGVAGLAGKALGFGAEGAAFGAGNAVSDYALGDPNLTAQKVLAHVGTGFALGAGLGALSKGAEFVLPKAVKGLKSGLEKFNESFIGSAENPGLGVQAASVPGSMLSGLPRDEWMNRVYMALENGDKAASMRKMMGLSQDLFKNGSQVVSDLYEKAGAANIGEALKDMPLEQAQSTAGKIVNDLGDKVLAHEWSSPEVEKAVFGKLEGLQEAVTNGENAHSIFDAIHDFAKTVDREIRFDKLPNARQMADQDALKGIRSIVRGALSDENAWGQAATHYAETAGAYSDFAQSRKAFIKGFMQKNANGVLEQSPSKWQSFFNNFAKPGNISQDVKKEALASFFENLQSLSEKAENYHGYEAGTEALSDKISSLIKEHEMLQNVAEAVSSEPKSKINLFQDVIAEKMLHYAGLSDPLATGVIAAREASKVFKNPYQLGQNLARTQATLSAVGKMAETVGNAIQRNAGSIFSSSVERALPGNVLKVDFGSYSRKIKPLEEFGQNPEALIDHMAAQVEPLSGAAPNIASALNMSMARSLQFLQSKIPRPQQELPLSGKWKPSHGQMEQFLRYYNAVHDPLSILKDIKHGGLRSDSIEAIQATHPELLQEMRQQVIARLNPNKASKLPYSVKVSLSKFLGQPLEESMTPQAIQMAQVSYQMPQRNTQSVQKNAGKPTLGGLKELQLAHRAGTETQDLESDERA